MLTLLTCGRSGAGALSLLLLGACASPPTPCAVAHACAAGEECLANRCVPSGGEPVPERGQRVLLTLEQLGVWDEPQGSWQALGPRVLLGDAALGEQTLCLRFAQPEQKLQIHAAFLLVYPFVDAPPPGSDLRFVVQRFAAAWPSSGAPRLDGRTVALGSAHAGAPLPLRIDVTELVRELQRGREANLGLTIRAASDALPGASYHTGVAGRAPELEIYTRAPAQGGA
jgi:hypothetical protein